VEFGRFFPSAKRKKVWWLRGWCFERGKEMAWTVGVVPGESRHLA
jgi:hypothetical protein